MTTNSDQSYIHSHTVESAARRETMPRMTGSKHPLLEMKRSPKSKTKPPHLFVLDALAPLNPEVRRMFSGFAVYVGNRLLLMLRDHAKSGVWGAMEQ
jgi:hypothetical protein